MMRSFGSRSDTFVTDEPFYAHYLFKTGLQHPGFDEIIQSQETDWRKVAGYLTGPIPEEKEVWYQKQMTHHQLSNMAKDWMVGADFRHAFLIRDPAEMLPSLFKILGEDLQIDQTGYPQQVEIFRYVKLDQPVIVADSKDILLQPELMLRKLCDALQLTYQPQMLNWQAGPRNTDGVWARHWYDRVNASSTFSRYVPKDDTVPDSKLDLLKECQDLYDELAEHKA